MKIKKLTPDQIKEGSLGFKDYRKQLLMLLKIMRFEHNAADNPTQYVVLLDHEFKDKPGKKMAMLIPGNQTANWTKYIKEEFKERKKLMSLGTCYIKTDADGKNPVIMLKQVKGAAKKPMLMKQLTKMTLKSSGFAVEMDSGAAVVEENELEEAPVAENQGDGQATDLQADLKKLVRQIAAVNKSINLKDGLHEDDLQKAEMLKKLIRKFAATLKAADVGIRTEFGEAFKKTRLLYKKVEEEISKLKALDADLVGELDDFLSEEEDAGGAADVDAGPAESKAEAVRQNSALMKEINDLVAEIGLHAMV